MALNRKDVARENVAKLLASEPRMNAPDGKYAVRINAPQTELATKDIKAIFMEKSMPRTLFVPKTNYNEDVKWLYNSIQTQLDKGYFSPRSDQIRLFFYMETAESLLNLREIITAAISLSTQLHRSMFKLEGFVFGSDDFCADIGAERTADATELIYARQKLVTYCKAFNLKAIDMVYIDYKDLVGLKTQSEQGRRMGFTGKQVIHPGQVDVVQNAFMPSEVKVRWAQGVVDAFKENQNSGAGAFTYEGQMIDMPSLLQAENVLAIVDRVKKQ